MISSVSLDFLDLRHNVMTFHHLLFQTATQTARGAQKQRRQGKTRNACLISGKKEDSNNSTALCEDAGEG